MTCDAGTYADASGIGSTYKTAVTAMQQAGIMQGGTGNRFNPKSSATRAEVSSMLHHYIKLTIDPATVQGWAANDDGRRLYYKDGKALTGWQTIEGQKFFFDTEGVLQTGWKKDDKGNWHYLSSKGLLVGWQDIDSRNSKKRYYLPRTQQWYPANGWKLIRNGITSTPMDLLQSALKLTSTRSMKTV